MLKTLFSLLFVGLLSAACIWGVVHTVGEDAPDKGHIPPARLPRVTVYKVRSPEPVRYVRVMGDVVMDTQNKIMIPVNGMLRSVSARPGQTLKQGDVIAELDDSALRREHQQVQVKLGLAQGKLQVLEGKGTKDLHKMKAAKLKVEALMAHMEDLETLMDNLIIRMPRAGKLGELPLKAGENVKAGDVLTIIDSGNGPMIEAWLTAEDYARLKPEQSVSILMRKDHSTAMIHGSWRPSTEPVEPDSMLRGIWVHPPVAQRKLLKEGQRLTLLVPVKGLGVMQTPETAVQWMNGEAWVYVIERTHSKSHVEGRKVRVGETLGDEVEILEGLAPGEVIVLEGANLLHNKQEVAVMGADVLESDQSL